MEKRLKGVHTGSSHQMTSKREMQQQDGSWRREGEESVLQAVGMQPLQMYIVRRQATVAEWVTNRPIFEVCTYEIGYEGGGRQRALWWRHTAADTHLRATLKAILAAAREW